MVTKHANREVYETPDTVLEAMPMLGWSRWSRAVREDLGAHRHEGLWEICLIVRGPVDWWAGEAAARVFEVPPGSYYITPPGMTHGGVGSVMHPCEIYWLHLRLPWAGVSEEQLTQLQPMFRASAEAARIFASLVEEHRRRDGHSVLACQALLMQLLAQIQRDAQGAKAQGTLSPQIAQAVEQVGRVSARGRARVSVADLAQQAGLSVSQFRLRFEQETGFSPMRYVQLRRIREAKRLLLQSKLTLAQITTRLGFASTQHFATTFRQFTGATPSEYRKAAAGSGALRPHYQRVGCIRGGDLL